MQRVSTASRRCIFCTLVCDSPLQQILREFQIPFLAKYDKRLRHDGPSIRRTNKIPPHSPNFRSDAFQRRSGKSRTAKASAPSPEQVLALLPHRVEKVLQILKTQLTTRKASDKNDLTQMAVLDPKDQYWKEFTNTVSSAIDPTKRSDRNVSNQRLYNKLVQANSRSDMARFEIRKELHFAFIDYAITAKSRDISTSSSAHSSTSRPAKATDLRYPTEWFAKARALQRSIHLHVGPTNSGKTYNALKRLEESGNGFYAGPLRLLAHEVYSRFQAKGVPCDLVTGDDIRLDQNAGARLYSSTVEMVDVGRQVDVAVIDEIQMMAAEDRGWAWTRALLGANAKEVHLCGETRVVPLIRELAALMGDTLHIHEYQRLNPLKVMSRSLRGNLKNLRKGDCVVSFSVMNIHALKKQIELDTGRRVAIVYGSLPPETRAQQAALFNDPDNDYDFLVASDAIGMGLNLSVKRIIFETVMKSNGVFKERLTVPHIKQIAGRAGRFRSAHQANQTHKSNDQLNPNKETEKTDAASVGLVTCIDEADLPIIREAIETEPAPIAKAGILPPSEFIMDYAARLPAGVPFEYILERICDDASIHSRFSICEIRDQLRIARAIEPINDLGINQKCIFIAAPTSLKDSTSSTVLTSLARCVAEQRSVSIVDISEIPLEVLQLPLSDDREYLRGLERLHQALIMYLWLSYRFINTFKDQDMAHHAKTLVEEKINQCLNEFSANPRLRKRLNKIKQSTAMKKSAANFETDLLQLSNQMRPDIANSTAVPMDWAKDSEGFESTNVHS